jgi:ABC-type glycerol-3-phosphate transport system permease component
MPTLDEGPAMDMRRWARWMLIGAAAGTVTGLAFYGFGVRWAVAEGNGEPLELIWILLALVSFPFSIPVYWLADQPGLRSTLWATWVVAPALQGGAIGALAAWRSRRASRPAG